MIVMFEESQRLELKRELNDKLEKEVVAFLNSGEGGLLCIGVDDDGQVVGVDSPDEAQLQVTMRLRDNILPSCLGLFSIDLQSVKGKTVVAVTIASGQEKPYYLKKLGMSPSGCFMRVGSSTLPMPTKRIEELFSMRVRTTLRNTMAPRQNLTFAQLKIYYESLGKPLNEKFAETLEFFTPDEKYNYVAYLLSDSNGTSIKFAKYADETKINLIENEELGFCSLIKATYRILDKFRVENRTFTQITPTARDEYQLINETALREIVINAIVHNDYSKEFTPIFELFADRLEITTYGGLQVGQSEDDFFQWSQHASQSGTHACLPRCGLGGATWIRHETHPFRL